MVTRIGNRQRPPVEAAEILPHSRTLLLYFSREEKALTFAVRCGNPLKLKEVEKDLDLSHDLKGPAVVHGDWLRAA